jgi:hypothetical protein
VTPNTGSPNNGIMWFDPAPGSPGRWHPALPDQVHPGRGPGRRRPAYAACLRRPPHPARGDGFCRS